MSIYFLCFILCQISAVDIPGSENIIADIFISTDFEKIINHNFKKNFHALVETKHSDEAECFTSCFINKISKEYPEQEIGKIIFNTYSFYKNKWDKAAGEIIINKKIVEEALLKKRPLVVIFKKAELLGDSDKEDILREYVELKKQFDAAGFCSTRER